MSGLGVERVPEAKAGAWLRARPGFYDVVVASRPSTLTERLLRELEEAFRVRLRGAVVAKEGADGGIGAGPGDQFPGEGRPVFHAGEYMDELDLIERADVAVAVSDAEEKVIEEVTVGRKDMRVVGHVMRRRGILSSRPSTTMFYNGDAIWHFLKEVYPAVVRALLEPSLEELGASG